MKTIFSKNSIDGDDPITLSDIFGIDESTIKSNSDKIMICL